MEKNKNEKAKAFSLFLFFQLLTNQLDFFKRTTDRSFFPHFFSDIFDVERENIMIFPFSNNFTSTFFVSEMDVTKSRSREENGDTRGDHRHNGTVRYDTIRYGRCRSRASGAFMIMEY